MVDLRLNVYSVLSAQYRREVFLLALVNGIDHMHKLSGARSTVLAFYGAWHTRRCHLAALTRIGDSALSGTKSPKDLELETDLSSKKPIKTLTYNSYLIHPSTLKDHFSKAR